MPTLSPSPPSNDRLGSTLFVAALIHGIVILGVTFAVTSVGHTQVRAILPMIGGTLGFGVGRVTDVPVVRAGRIEIAPQLTLSLAFDHRVLDGALAAELLALVKDRLESWEES